MKIAILVFLLTLSQSNSWQVISSEGPEPRYINNLAYGDGKIFLYGGKNNENQGFEDLWEWDGKEWNLLGVGAPKRWDHSYVFMDHSNQLFLFGGRAFDDEGERIDLNDNWVYKDSEWKKLECRGPSKRSSHSLAYNEKNKRTILFGGRNGDNVFGDTWSFDGIAWQLIDAPGPTARYGHTLTYDALSETIFLFGGFNGETLLNDMWAFDGEKWKELISEIRPSARMAHTMQFDNSGVAVLFGGWDESNQVSGKPWIWAKGEWELQNDTNLPEARLSGALGFDESRNEFILFGGSTGFSGEFLVDTWKLKLP